MLPEIYENNKEVETKLGLHKLETFEAELIKSGIYRQGHKMDELIKDKVAKYLQEGIVRPSKSHGGARWSWLTKKMDHTECV